MPMPAPATSLRVGTLNVHQFQEDYSQVLHVVIEKRLDIIGLQEVPKWSLATLAAALGADWTWCKSRGVAILSRYPLKVISTKGAKSKNSRTDRHCMACINIAAANDDEDGHDDQATLLEVVCVHLDHRKESTRLAEVQKLLLACPNNDASDRLWLGDFNALTRSDYSSSKWNEISSQRSLNSWEEPVEDLTTFLTHQGRLTDTWKAASQTLGPRFATRVDYVYASPVFMQKWQVESCEHVDTASDHNLVVTNFVRRQS